MTVSDKAHPVGVKRTALTVTRVHGPQCALGKRPSSSRIPDPRSIFGVVAITAMIDHHFRADVPGTAVSARLSYRPTRTQNPPQTCAFLETKPGSRSGSLCGPSHPRPVASHDFPEARTFAVSVLRAPRPSNCHRRRLSSVQYALLVSRAISNSAADSGSTSYPQRFQEPLPHSHGPIRPWRSGIGRRLTDRSGRQTWSLFWHFSSRRPKSSYDFRIASNGRHPVRSADRRRDALGLRRSPGEHSLIVGTLLGIQDLGVLSNGSDGRHRTAFGAISESTYPRSSILHFRVSQDDFRQVNQIFLQIHSNRLRRSVRRWALGLCAPGPVHSHRQIFGQQRQGPGTSPSG